MEKLPQIFKSTEFGNITAIEKDGEPWFVGREIAGILGYKKTANAINAHCKYVKILKNTKSPATQLLNIPPRGLQIINEKDLYRLIMRSELPNVEVFQDWVCDEVLPSIRKTGKYSTSETPEPKQELPSWAIEGNGISHFYLKYGAPQHIAATEEAKHVLKIGGPDLRDKIGLLPCSDNIQSDQKYLEPTELGKEFDISSIAMNKLLAQLGLQTKATIGWKTTDRGSKISTDHAWSRGGKSGYNYKWNLEEVAKIHDAQLLNCSTQHRLKF